VLPSPPISSSCYFLSPSQRSKRSPRQAYFYFVIFSNFSLPVIILWFIPAFRWQICS
jgi:hypothetical protein